MEYVVGIDAGGTKTLAYLGDYNGNIMAKTKCGPGNYHSTGSEKMIERFRLIISNLSKKGNIDKEQISLISIGAAGVDRDKDKIIFKKIIGKLNLECKTIVNNDSKVALLGAFGKLEGIIIICGTGSIGYGISSRGELFRVGGWGHLIGDEGSGYYISIKALTKIMKMYDGRLSNSILKDKILSFLGLSKSTELIDYVYSNDINKDSIAKLAPIVLEAAKENDPIANQIIDDANYELAKLANTLIKKLNYKKDKIELSLAGGIFDNSKLMREKFKEKVNSLDDNIKLIKPMFNAAIGALLMGWDEENIDYNINQLLNQRKSFK